ncbi:MAG: hypothetical protein RL497_2095 [Pseudomonadota bacterium]|jgi:putative transcriptional regulator
MSDEFEQFQADLLESTHQMKAGSSVRSHAVKVSVAAAARAKIGVSQAVFATMLGISKRTLQEWEQGRKEPSGAAKTLFKVALKHPETLRDLGA